jgi:hypothetical protein
MVANFKPGFGSVYVPPENGCLEEGAGLDKNIRLSS